MRSITTYLLAGLFPIATSPAIAALQLAQFDTGNSLQGSYYELQATSRATGEVKSSGIGLLPFSELVSATVLGVSASDRYLWSGDEFLVEFVNHQKSGGGFITSHGAMIFNVDQDGVYLLDGKYLVSSPGVQEIYLGATWQDLSSGRTLFDSIQWNASSGGTYILGGLQGNREATLIGNSSNLLQTGHIYRILWTASINNFSPIAYDATAAGSVTLIAVPEASSAALFATGVLGLLTASFVRVRRKKKGKRGRYPLGIATTRFAGCRS